MPSSYTPSLKLILQATGENSGNWGTLTNSDFTSLVDIAVAGYESISMTDADRTLTNGDGSAANEARYAFINMTGTLTAARNVIVPTASKLFFFKNATTGGFAVTLKTSAGTGISVPNGKAMVLMCDGTNVIDAVTSFSSLSLATALPVTSGGTGVTTSTGTTNVVLSNSPTLVTPALGTPSALVGTNITGTASGLTAGNVTTNANLTGPITSVGNATTIVGPIPAVTLSGTISGAGNQINNVIIGTVTPLAGSFTTLTASGNVGIGTASPGEALVVTSSTATTLYADISNTKAAGQGDAYLRIIKAPNGNSNGIQLNTGGTNKWIVGTGIVAIDDNFKIYNPAVGVSLSITQSTGDVGIGTGTPITLKSATTLQVLGNARLGTANDNGLLALGDYTSNNANVGVWRGAGGAYGGGGNFLNLGGYDGVTFTTGAADISAQTERVRITPLGYVGIGITNPTQTLQTYDNSNAERGVLITNAMDSTSASALLRLTAGTASGSILRFPAAHSVKPNELYIVNVGTISPITFATQDTERMRIDSAGNVGIGTTSPSASAILDAQSTTKGVRMPNMTTTQKNAIASPAAGLMVFDTTLAKLCVYTGAAWETVTSV